ncbi:LAME_0D08724g1_1 [Lachancea meyersii CBS 8951]|uniref:LAME_0D08724g1_1 n=1 Tax=Lachancea meyersii CBS 8951 TaxID=1266667 RepID=A0A1G4JAJ1_9SACH|nr:LAME_0D08724g1_1 [Lachancea meyersii CBS 8951]
MNPAKIHIFKSTPIKRASVEQGSSKSPTGSREIHVEANKLLQMLKSKSVKSEPMPQELAVYPAEQSQKITIQPRDSGAKDLQQQSGVSAAPKRSFHDRISQWITIPASSLISQSSKQVRAVLDVAPPTGPKATRSETPTPQAAKSASSISHPSVPPAASRSMMKSQEFTTTSTTQSRPVVEERSTYAEFPKKLPTEPQAMLSQPQVVHKPAQARPLSPNVAGKDIPSPVANTQSNLPQPHLAEQNSKQSSPPTTFPRNHTSGGTISTPPPNPHNEPVNLPPAPINPQSSNRGAENGVTQGKIAGVNQGQAPSTKLGTGLEPVRTEAEITKPSEVVLRQPLVQKNPVYALGSGEKETAKLISTPQSLKQVPVPTSSGDGLPSGDKNAPESGSGQVLPPTQSGKGLASREKVATISKTSGSHSRQVPVPTESGEGVFFGEKKAAIPETSGSGSGQAPAPENSGPDHESVRNDVYRLQSSPAETPAPLPSKPARNENASPREAGINSFSENQLESGYTIGVNSPAAPLLDLTKEANLGISQKLSTTLRYIPQLTTVSDTSLSAPGFLDPQSTPVRPSALGDQLLAGDRSELFDALHVKYTGAPSKPSTDLQRSQQPNELAVSPSAVSGKALQSSNAMNKNNTTRNDQADSDTSSLAPLQTGPASLRYDGALSQKASNDVKKSGRKGKQSYTASTTTKASQPKSPQKVKKASFGTSSRNDPIIQTMPINNPQSQIYVSQWKNTVMQTNGQPPSEKEISSMPIVQYLESHPDQSNKATTTNNAKSAQYSSTKLNSSLSVQKKSGTTSKRFRAGTILEKAIRRDELPLKGQNAEQKLNNQLNSTSPASGRQLNQKSSAASRSHTGLTSRTTMQPGNTANAVSGSARSSVVSNSSKLPTVQSTNSQTEYVSTAGHQVDPAFGSASRRAKRKGTKATDLARGPNMKLRSVKDTTPKKSSFAENMRELEEIVVGPEMSDFQRAERTPQLSQKVSSGAANESDAPLLQRASMLEVENVSSDASDASSDSSGLLTKETLDAVVPRRKRPLSGGIGDSNARKISKISRPSEEIVTDSPLHSVDGNTDKVLPETDIPAESNTVLRSDPEQDRKKIERLVARRVGGVMASAKRLKKGMLLDMILSGVIICPPLKSGRSVTSSNNICNNKNYEESPALYLQQLSKRARLEVSCFERIQMPIVDKRVTRIDEPTKENLRKGLRDACFYLDLYQERFLGADEKDVVSARIQNLNHHLQRLGCLISDKKSSFVNVVIIINDFLKSDDYTEAFEYSGTQIWSYAYAMRLFELLEAEKPTPNEDIGQVSGALPRTSAMMKNADSHGNSIMAPTDQHPRNGASESYVGEKPPIPSLEKGHDQVRSVESNKEDSLLSENTGLEERSLNRGSNGTVIAEDERLRYLASEVIEDQFKLASLHGQLSRKDKVIADLTSRLKEEESKSQKWQFVFESLSPNITDNLKKLHSQPQRDRSASKERERAVSQPAPSSVREPAQGGVLDENVVENIHVITSALRARSDNHATASTLQTSAPGLASDSLSLESSATIVGNDVRAGSKNTAGAVGVKDTSPQDFRNRGFNLTRLAETARKLEASMASQDELQKQVQKLTAERKDFEKALIHKTQQMEAEKRDADRKQAESAEVMKNQHHIIVHLKEQMKLEKEKRRALSSRLQALISCEDSGGEEHA